MLTWLEPQPTRDERPALFPNPFDDVAPHPLARRCAELVMAELRRTQALAPGVLTSLLHRAEGGKMLGVLAVEDRDGRVGFLRAVSGQVERAWRIEGFVPPLFDVALRDAVEPPAEVVVKQLTARVDAARNDPTLHAARAALKDLDARHAATRAELRARHAINKESRHAQRASTTDATALHALAQLSRGDDAERRRHEATVRAERAQALAVLAPLERRLAALERLRRVVSQEVMRRIWDTYPVRAFNGETTPLRALFPQGDPPSGAADCAGPRLLDAARAQGLKPLALAEFWWGGAPPGGGRVEGMYFPACREKCGPVMPFQLRGLEVAPRQTWRPREVGEEELRVVHEDARFLVLDKPSGLLSVQARDEAITDNLVARVQRRFPEAMAVHRLDLDTSGLLLVALDGEMYRLLQQQFLSRAVEKEYAALLEGALQADEGVIELPLRVDLEQRPRQVVDFEHGKAALTRWKVVAREGARTRVAFFPLTGRTHQLRVHAAHPRGLATPIVGDRLYGRPNVRLMLHAAKLRFVHPLTGAAVSVESPTPF